MPPGAVARLMFARWKKLWRRFQSQKPGRRFRTYHEHNRGAGYRRKWWGRILIWGVGLGCLAVGAFLAIAPGPAFIFIIPGAALLATESHAVARALDWIDVKLSPWFAALGRRWRRLPRGAQLGLKIASTCAAVAGLVAGLFLTLR